MKELKAVQRDPDLTPRQKGVEKKRIESALERTILTPDDIRSHIKRNDVDPAGIAYVTQAPGQGGNKFDIPPIYPRGFLHSQDG